MDGNFENMIRIRDSVNVPAGIYRFSNDRYLSFTSVIFSCLS